MIFLGLSKLHSTTPDAHLITVLADNLRTAKKAEKSLKPALP
jgi:hypothetical protein